MNTKKIVLASKSPRRHDILNGLGIPFSVIPSNAEETHHEHKTPEQIVIDNAKAKAMEIAGKCKDSFVLGADTIVYFDKKILTKPRDKKEAVQHLKLLSNNTHYVYTGCALINTSSSVIETGSAVTSVRFCALTDKQIDVYIDKVHPYDKAGGYAIQGFGALVVEGIDGCFFNVMGLPVRLVDELFCRFGSSLFDYCED